jgi:hypothetical protein
MVVPLIARSVAAVVGALLVITAWRSVVGTLIVPRQVSGWLTRWVDKCVNGSFRLATRSVGDYQRRDRMLAAQAPAILLTQLAAWLGIAFVGYWLLFWPFVKSGITSAFTVAGSSIFTLGFSEPAGAAPAAIVFAAAATGLVIVTLQIAYLPTLYAAFNRRETEVALLNARAGVPSWGRSYWRAPTTRWGRCRPSTPCPICTAGGNGGPRTSRKATPRTCRWCGSAPPGRCRPG